MIKDNRTTGIPSDVGTPLCGQLPLRTLTSTDLEDIRQIIRYEVRNDSDIVRGVQNILQYLGLSRKSIQTFYRWVNRSGMPASKTPNGKWWMSRRLMDQWMYSRHLIMTKAVELGMQGSYGGRKGKSMPNPEKLSEGDRAKIMASLNEDRCK